MQNGGTTPFRGSQIPAVIDDPGVAILRPLIRTTLAESSVHISAIRLVGSAATRGAAASTLCSMRAGGECCLRDLQKSLHEPGTQRSSGPKEAYVPGEPVA